MASGSRRTSIATTNPSRYQKSLMAGSAATLPSIPATRTTLAHEGFSARNEDWNSVQNAVVTLFQQKKLPEMELSTLHENVKNLVESEAGPFIYDYLKNQLLKRGMVIIREMIKRSQETDKLKFIGQIWTYFFTETLPLLQAILHPIQTKDYSIRQLTLVGFRDNVLLRSQLDDLLQSTKDIPASIIHMLLVLQSIHECTPPSPNYLELEKLVAMVVNPYLGYHGLYLGSSEPSIKSSELQKLHHSKSRGKADGRPENLTLPRRHRSSIPREGSLSPVGSITHLPFLRTVVEQDPVESRRHSVNVTFV